MASASETQEGRAYSDWCQSCAEKPSQEESDAKWLTFLTDSFKARRDLRIFETLVAAIRKPGIAAARAYVTHAVDSSGYVQRSKENFSDAYVGSLLSHGLVSSIPQPDYDEMEAEFYLECLKALEPVRQLNLTEKDDCSPMWGPVATMLYRLLELTHGILGLPSVSELFSVIRPITDTGTEIMLSGKYDAYAMSGEAERQRYQQMLVETMER